MPLSPEQITRIKTTLGTVVENEPMANHTNFRIGGLARLYYVATSSEVLLEAVKLAVKEEIPWYVYGGGSNLLVSDKGFEGLMIQAANREVEVEGSKVSCGAGAISSMVARKASEAGLVGFEWAVGVPGTVGGAIFGNAGCYGGEMKDAVMSVRAYHVPSGEERLYTNEQCRFDYRDSFFKHEPHVILSCSLVLKSGDREGSLQKLKEISEKRKEHQPLGDSSAGCMFKNFEYQEDKQVERLKQEIDVPQEMLDAKRIAAGWLIEKCGLRGYELGGVSISRKHGNFLINNGTGTADQVAQIVSICQMTVRDKFHVALQPEVQFVGFG
ncbi:UDP-N-acetylmuramate dehydrogenase [Candidatus Uhrbacteria bacterium]|nr:UDP-N-acetylmuramate dehydrogenase [Candidatus Uhrbacteria bacterium]MBD3284140.1 UDP-N-acetylmuramate dehydrogenase [Candidatus Uhrbacteria bacterium]